MNQTGMPGLSVAETTTELATRRLRIDELERSLCAGHDTKHPLHGADATPARFVRRTTMEGTASQIDDEFCRSLVKHLGAARSVR